jgi:AcrR family transcriptional regulator
MKGSPVRPSAGRTPKTVPAGTDIGLQARKSQATQRAVLDATMRCLVELGYTNTTMESIAKCARISRGAIMHHYASRADVIACAADYLATLRLDEFSKGVCAKVVQEVGIQQPNLRSFRRSAELVMQYYERPSFTALHELLVAARTDRSIAPLMKKIEKRINTQMLTLVVEYLPYWESMPATEAVLVDLLHFLSRGVALSHPNKLDRERQRALLDLLADVAYQRFLADQKISRERAAG